jgi:hypothetical protein
MNFSASNYLAGQNWRALLPGKALACGQRPDGILQLIQTVAAFADEIVGAGSEHLLTQNNRRGMDQYRSMRVKRANPPAELNTVPIGKRNVQKNKAESDALKQSAGDGCSLCIHSSIAFRLGNKADQFGSTWIVLDNEDGFGN